MISSLLLLLFFFASLASAVYLFAAILRLNRLRRGKGSRAPVRPPVTLLKPVCGVEAELEENLSSFCRQDYPVFQVIFGVREENDPAVPVIRRVMAAFPDADLQLIVDEKVAGPNLKASNLANLLPAARHDILVVADSDMRVDGNYLAAVAAPFADPRVGAVTCPYSGTPHGGLASNLGALFLTDWFLPSTLVAIRLQEPDFCLGATMAVRRQALEAIGGFTGLAWYLADDFQLGHQVRKAGWKVHFSSYVVENIVSEANLRSLIAHEVRWARTVRICRPAGYAFSFIASGGMSLAVLFLLLSGFSFAGWLMVGLLSGLRLLLHFRLRSLLRAPPAAAPWLLPLRDALCLGIWGAGLFGHRVRWRERTFQLQRSGEMRGLAPPDRHLVVTADDFGSALPVNEAVEQAHRDGILNTASLMVSGEAAADAVERARRLPQLRTGLHLVLTRGRPVLPPDQIPELVEGNGPCFADNLVLAGLRFFFLPGARRQLAREIRAQFQVFSDTGLSLDHLSVHNHLQLHPTVLGLVLRIGSEFGLQAVRVPWEPLRPIDSTYPGRLAAAFVLAPWAAVCRWRVRQAGMRCNHRLFGIFDAGRLDAAHLLDFIRDLPPGLSEIHLHPATSTPEGADPAMASWRPQGELTALIDPQVGHELERSGITRGGYGDFRSEKQSGGVSFEF